MSLSKPAIEDEFLGFQRTVKLFQSSMMQAARIQTTVMQKRCANPQDDVSTACGGSSSESEEEDERGRGAGRGGSSSSSSSPCFPVAPVSCNTTPTNKAEMQRRAFCAGKGGFDVYEDGNYINSCSDFFGAATDSETGSPVSCTESPYMRGGGSSSSSSSSFRSSSSRPLFESEKAKESFMSCMKFLSLSPKDGKRAEAAWKYALETLLMNATLAKAATAFSLFGGSPVVMAAGVLAAPPADALAERDQNANGNKNMTCFQMLMFGFTMVLGHAKANPTPCALYSLGASWGPAVARGQIWRLFCPMFLHANLMHLFFNVFFQLRIGFGMEKQFGKSKMQLVYVTCGLIGNLISVMLDPFKLSVGASTAGFGLIGVWVAEIILSWELLGAHRDRTLIWILFMLVSVTSMSGMTPNVDLYGHFGGAFGGFLIAILMADMKKEHQPPWYNYVKKFALIAMTGLLGAGAWKLFVKTPLAPIPDCAWPNPFAGSGMFAGVASSVAASPLMAPITKLLGASS